VADGRDMGTVIFPGASLKVFLTASAEQRAERRYKQLISKGVSANLPQIQSDLRRATSGMRTERLRPAGRLKMRCCWTTRRCRSKTRSCNAWAGGGNAGRSELLTRFGWAHRPSSWRVLCRQGR
jgi:hypothetical protein